MFRNHSEIILELNTSLKMIKYKLLINKNILSQIVKTVAVKEINLPL